jgi:hypothetical protein
MNLLQRRRARSLGSQRTRHGEYTIEKRRYKGKSSAGKKRSSIITHSRAKEVGDRRESLFEDSRKWHVEEDSLDSSLARCKSG